MYVQTARSSVLYEKWIRNNYDMLFHCNVSFCIYFTFKLCVSFRCVRGQLKCDGTCAETRFRLLAKRTSPFKSAGASVQSITGSRDVRISGSNAVYITFWGSVKGTSYPLHSPVSLSLPLPCVTVCNHISTGVYSVNKYLNQIGPSVPEIEIVCQFWKWIDWKGLSASCKLMKDYLWRKK